MNITPKAFLFPSAAAHAAIAALVLLAMWRATSMRSAMREPFRVNLVQVSAPAPQRTTITPPPAPRPAPAPPKPAPPPPKPVPPPPKPVPPPPKPPTPAPQPAERTILPTPKDVVQKQTKWQEEQARKAREAQAKRAQTNVVKTVVIKPPPAKKVVLTAEQLEANKAFEDARKRYEALQKDIESDRTSAQRTAEQKRAQEDAARQAAAAQQAAQQAVQQAAQQAAMIDDYFRNSIRTAIDAAWAQPDGVIGACEVSFRLYRNGRVENVRVSKRGAAGLEESGVKAVRAAAFKPFPAGLNREYLDVEVPFEIQPGQ